MIKKHFNKENLHHAYLIEGARENLLIEIFALLKELEIEIEANPDFYHISMDTLKIDDARDLKSLTAEKSVLGGKKIFLLSVNNILPEAQNTLLKIFEEPSPGTHFFIIIPDVAPLQKTLLSRFYLISDKNESENAGLETAEKFLNLPLKNKLDFIKELLAEEDTEDREEEVAESPRTKALGFLNNLETALHNKNMSKTVFDIEVFEQLFKVREYLRQPGSSAKMLLESLALMMPKL